jgi:response regulator NasT
MKAFEATAIGCYRCLIVEDETLVAMGVRTLLEGLGHRVIATARDAEEAERVFRAEEPDLVLTDIRLGVAGGIDGVDLAARLLKIRACPILILTAYSDDELIERASAVGVFGYLIKPASEAALAAQIEIGVARFREHMVLLAEKESLAQNLENRKLVERAKSVLIKRAGLSEAEAHKRLQQESQKRRTSMVELAKRIIETEEVLGEN